ncbi:HSP20-like chaperone [Schizopora paradoxa]|uniref:HSP20-like chaperone n=1 Tax=Schizopora paradoxa TaxID=27342 RepID=A0A0H2SCS3_9AGAM|nr:HSP20-like chaperone [Schizopora paradoxa]
MSLTRQFLREFRPLFRMLDEPFGRTVNPTSSNALARHSPLGALFNDPFFSRGFEHLNVPAVDLTEHGSEYVVEAELPGVKKENVDIRIGDGGQSLTIEGRTFVRSASSAPATAAQEGQAADASTANVEGSSSAEASPSTQAVAQTNGEQVGTQLTTERSFSSTSSFSRTVWLPRRADGSNVKAKLEDGVLTVRIPKLEDSESVRVNIE